MHVGIVARYAGPIGIERPPLLIGSPASPVRIPEGSHSNRPSNPRAASAADTALGDREVLDPSSRSRSKAPYGTFAADVAWYWPNWSMPNRSRHRSR